MDAPPGQRGGRFSDVYDISYTLQHLSNQNKHFVEKPILHMEPDRELQLIQITIKT